MKYTSIPYHTIPNADTRKRKPQILSTTTISLKLLSSSSLRVRKCITVMNIILPRTSIRYPQRSGYFASVLSESFSVIYVHRGMESSSSRIGFLKNTLLISLKWNPHAASFLIIVALFPAIIACIGDGDTCPLG